MCAQAAFLRGYLDAVSTARLLPETPADVAALLDVFWLEKAVYELGYELDHRPDWLGIPLAALTERFGEEG